LACAVLPNRLAENKTPQTKIDFHTGDDHSAAVGCADIPMDVQCKGIDRPQASGHLQPWDWLMGLHLFFAFTGLGF